MHLTNSSIRSFYPLVFAMLLSACGGGGDDAAPSPTPIPSPGPTPEPTPEPSAQPTATPEPVMTAFGTLSGIEGLGYVSGEVTGITDASGTFEYESGQNITFTIGDILIGVSGSGDTLTLADLAETGAIETNLSRFLEVLDDDDNPENGILIIAAVRELAAGESIDFDQSTTAFVDDGNVQSVVATLTAVTSAGARMISDAVTPSPTPTPEPTATPTPTPEPTITPTPDPQTQATLMLAGEDVSFLGETISLTQFSFVSNAEGNFYIGQLGSVPTEPPEYFRAIQPKLIVIDPDLGTVVRTLDYISVTLQIRDESTLYTYNTRDSCAVEGADTNLCGSATFDLDNRSLTLNQMLIERREECEFSARECERLGLTDTIFELRVSGTLLWTQDDED